MEKENKRYLVYLRNKIYEHNIDNSKKYKDFYIEYGIDEVITLFSIYQYELNDLFSFLNNRLGSRYFLAQSSRELLNLISEIEDVQQKLENSKYSFKFISYYEDVVKDCKSFLKEYYGSEIPEDFNKIDVKEIEPIFILQDSVSVAQNNISYYKAKLKGSGSYANVYKYEDTFYNKFFAIKRAKKDITEKEYERFKREFLIMQELNSPYVIEVYKFNEEKKEYIMEYADYTLDKFIQENNSKLTMEERINIINQIFKAFIYINSKGRLHRDISTKNILIKEYDEIKVIKISDFGLVKIKNSTLTSLETELKGYFNDPKLELVGFANYDICHEVYALTRIVYFVITGKYRMEDIKNEHFKEFIFKGISDNVKERYRDVEDMKVEFNKIKKLL